MRVVNALRGTVGAQLIAMAAVPSAIAASSSPVRKASMTPRRSTSICPLPAGWDAVAARKPRFIIFGEIHGTQQAPAFVGDVACALASRGERILVAVEHSSTENAAFQKAWRLPEVRFASQLKQAGWASRDDGVGSKAMLALLVRLHRLARRGRLIDIVAFNGPKNEAQARRFSHLSGQGPHEAAQAENIRVAALAHPYNYIVVLVGNVHARKRIVRYGDEAFEPMAMQVGPSASTVTLSMEAAGGTAWSCQLKPNIQHEPGKPLSADAIVCGSFPYAGSVDLGRKPFISLTGLLGADRPPDYDGFFWLGKVSASTPAVRSAQP